MAAALGGMSGDASVVPPAQGLLLLRPEPEPGLSLPGGPRRPVGTLPGAWALAKPSAVKIAGSALF